ncbi:MAG: hypothetical protein IJ092_02985 [Atopobiaceae bacterium]|nr:hypothetical protein [Atopobiaceae bacterium]
MDFNELPSELQEKAKDCASVEDFAKLCADAGIELSSEDLEGMAGGIGPFGGPGCRLVCGVTFDNSCPNVLF